MDLLSSLDISDFCSKDCLLENDDFKLSPFVVSVDKKNFGCATNGVFFVFYKLKYTPDELYFLDMNKLTLEGVSKKSQIIIKECLEVKDYKILCFDFFKEAVKSFRYCHYTEGFLSSKFVKINSLVVDVNKLAKLQSWAGDNAIYAKCENGKLFFKINEFYGLLLPMANCDYKNIVAVDI